MLPASVLIVEDESIIALDIQTSLESAGYHVVAIATCAEEAIQNVETHMPDIVLMDIQLHGDRDGVETAAEIRKTFQLPVVYLTAHADDHTLQRAKATQPFGYILKPFDDRDLTTTVEIALSRHKTEAAVHLALQRERELNELKSRFVSVVSHEFRNPLNAILFSTELLQRYGAGMATEKREVYLARIQNSVKQMNQLLSDVLTIGETEFGTLTCVPKPLDLVPFCLGIVEDLTLSEHYRCPIEFNFDHYSIAPAPQAFPSNGEKSDGENLPLNLPLLDERLMRHVITNLLSNAVKYSRAGDPVKFQLQCDDQSITFRIQDRGIGIPQHDLPRLFEAFYRATNARSMPGTGLGLSIVKQCVDLQGGTLHVESEEGQGTLFLVTLPLTYCKGADR